MDTGRSAIMVRLPRKLHAGVVALAARECRTVPEQLAYIVRDALGWAEGQASNGAPGNADAEATGDAPA